MGKVEEEYSSLIEKFTTPDFDISEKATIANELDSHLCIGSIVLSLWKRLPLSIAFSSMSGLFIAKPPGANIESKFGESVQFTWGNHHFMIFYCKTSDNEHGNVSLWISDKDPVMKVIVSHDDNYMSHEILTPIRMEVGEWIDDLLSYYSAFMRREIISNATREKFRPEMENFWRVANI